VKNCKILLPAPLIKGEKSLSSPGDTLKHFLLKREDGRDFWEAFSKD
jgi:hypothetical protein